MTQRAIRVIALVNRREAMSLLGFPLMQCIDINDSETVQGLLGAHMSTRHAKALAVHLAGGTWTHDYSISAAQSLSVSTAMPKEVYALTQLFPQPTRTRQSVEYVPVPYGGRRRQNRS
jgi:Serine dehydrogenase proteinase